MMFSRDMGSPKKSELRLKAENRVAESVAPTSSMKAVEIERLVYELEVHQEELEIQNEELRRAQVDLQASCARYAELYDFAPVGYLTIDAGSSIVESNLTAATMLGMHRSTIIGRRFLMYLDGNSRLALRKHTYAVISDPVSQSCELTFASPIGDTTDICLVSNRVRSFTGEDWQCRIVMTDITQSKKIAITLVEKENHLKALADTLPVLIAYVDNEYRYQYCNAAHETWFNLSPAALIGTSIIDSFCKGFEQSIAVHLERALLGERADVELPLTHSSQGHRFLQWMLVPDIGVDGKVRGIHCLGIDTTEQKILRQQSENLRILSEQLDRLGTSERNVYELLIRGKANKFIANHLDMGMRTVERRRQSILHKLQVESLTDWLQKIATIQDNTSE